MVDEPTCFFPKLSSSSAISLRWRVLISIADFIKSRDRICHPHYKFGVPVPLDYLVGNIHRSDPKTLHSEFLDENPGFSKRGLGPNGSGHTVLQLLSE